MIWISSILLIVACVAITKYRIWVRQRCEQRGHKWLHTPEGIECFYCGAKLREGDYL
jgi:hypothetical protein